METTRPQAACPFRPRAATGSGVEGCCTRRPAGGLGSRAAQTAFTADLTYHGSLAVWPLGRLAAWREAQRAYDQAQLHRPLHGASHSGPQP